MENIAAATTKRINPQKMNFSKASYTDEQMQEFEKRRDEKFQEELKQTIAQKKLARSNKLLKDSGLECMIKNLNFDNYHTEFEWQVKAKQTAMEYADDPEGWLLACGQSGSGKTHLCTAVTGEIIKKGVPTLYMLWRQDSLKLKPGEWADPEERRIMLGRYKNIDCLYLDDLFKGKVTDADISLAFELLDERYRADRITIISTELMPQQLRAIDEAVAGRIIEKAGKHIIGVSQGSGRNYRLRKHD